ncbi:hypothetical protein V6246_05170 [Algibacter sp. TI.3.09]|uniref:hypothetical protein n=1 Tax=Algibacter sp. TI.3.09 TaxID=3121298 RepID=UPI00311FB779
MGKQEKTYKEVKLELKNKYQAWKVLAVAGYVNGANERLANNIIEEVAKDLGFIPSYFATIILTEGLGINYLENSNNFSKNAPYGVRNDIIVSGYQIAGTDDFGSEFNRYKKYLPNTFNEGKTIADIEGDAEFIQHHTENEREKTVSAYFKNMESAIWACGATLAHRRDLFLRHAKELGHLTPTEDELAYWTYLYYQGEGRARTALEKAATLDIFARNTDYGSRVVTLDNREPNDVALSNLASWRYLQWSNTFSE